MSEIVIRPAQSHAELHACVEMQIQVWNLAPRDAVPFTQLHAAHGWGGQVLVALDGDRPVGFCYGFMGRPNGQPALCSHMLAVLPEYRGRAIGAQLKLAQGRWALANGFDLITWTYDPLEAVNASLNIRRLGGIVRRYLVNHYGEMADGLNEGLPSDRLLVEWHLNSPLVARILAGEQGSDNLPEESVRCPIPLSFQKLKASNPAEALRWRLTVRERLVGALAAGYVIVGFQAVDANHSQYVLTKEHLHAR